MNPLEHKSTVVSVTVVLEDSKGFLYKISPVETSSQTPCGFNRSSGFIRKTQPSCEQTIERARGREGF